MRNPDKLSSGKIFSVFLVSWGILNLVQAFFTPLHNDEAYYWMFSQYPAWGYYDHPPMIAMMIRIGYFIFKNEVGVRILVIVAQLLSMIVIWSMIGREKRDKPVNALLIVLVFALMPVLNMYGFLATPDSPLILFTVLVLFFYKRFLEEEGWANTFALGLMFACLMYSKYHGGLLIIFLLLSNLRLLFSFRFIAASAFALVLFTPHVLWQVNNDFPSLQYHLVDRVTGFDIAQVPEYLMNLLLIHNPFVFPLFMWVILKIKTTDKFGRSLLFIIWGFILFFFVSSFRYHVEPQWIALIVIPFILLVFNTDFIYPKFRYFRNLFLIVFPIFLFARIALMFDILPLTFLKKEFHRHRKWTTNIEKIAQGKPVVFTNAYQDPSLYTFYTGGFAHSLDNKNYRKTQFDLWNFEEELHGKEVCYVPHWLDSYFKSKMTPAVISAGDTIWHTFFRDFQSLQRKCAILDREEYTFTSTAEDSINVKIFNPYSYTLDLAHPELPVAFQLAFLRNGILQDTRPLTIPPNKTKLAPGDTISLSGKFSVSGMEEGEYMITIDVVPGILYDTYNSEFRKAVIVR
jgi:hypothetical protein